MNEAQQKWLESFYGTKNFYWELLAGDASNRKYYRIRKGADTYILSIQGEFQERDCDFLRIQKIFKDMEIPVPQIYGFNESLGLILQQDLGNLDLQKEISLNHVDFSSSLDDIFYPVYSNGHMRVRRGYQIIDLIKKIFLISKKEIKRSFDLAKLGFEFGWTWKHLIVPNSDRSFLKKYSQGWLEETLLISKTLEKSILYLAHRDLHSRNIIIYNDQPYLIDFQDARWGTPYYDLVSFIFDSYIVYDFNFEKEMINYYKQHVSNYFDSNLYLLQALQRLIKAAGSFISFFEIKGDRRYLGYIKPTLSIAYEISTKIKEVVILPEIIAALLNIDWEKKKND